VKSHRLIVHPTLRAKLIEWRRTKVSKHACENGTAHGAAKGDLAEVVSKKSFKKYYYKITKKIVWTAERSMRNQCFLDFKAHPDVDSTSKMSTSVPDSLRYTVDLEL